MGNKETKIFNLLLKDPFKYPTVSVLNVPEAIRICRLLIQLDLCVRNLVRNKYGFKEMYTFGKKSIGNLCVKKYKS